MEYTLGFGGSQIAVIMGISPFKTRYQLWAELSGLVEPKKVEGPHIQRGHMAELVARDALERETGVKYVQTAWPCEDGLTRCTDDGYSAELNQILEIKAMSLKAHEEARVGVIPPYYMAQVQWNLMRTKASDCQFISVRPESDYERVSIQVTHDLVMQEKMLEAAREFKRLIETGTPPELVEGDFINLGDDSEFYALTEDYKTAAAEQKAAEAKVEEIKERILEIMGHNPGIKGNGLTVTRYSRKGNVDYKKVPELKGVDLEPYRGKPIQAYRFTVEKEC